MRRGIVGILLFGAVAVVAGLVGYQAGIASGAATAGATVVVASGFPWGGFLFLTFLILFIGFPFFVFAGMSRAVGRHGRWGHGWAAAGGPEGPGGTSGPGGPWMRGGPWAHGSSGQDDPRRQWVAEMHRKLHEMDATAAGSRAAANGMETGSAASANGTAATGAAASSGSAAADASGPAGA